PYIFGGGRPPGTGAAGYDCSSAVSTVLQAGGFKVAAPWTTDQLRGFGDAGDGRHITVGVRGTSGRNAHAMMNFYGHWLEAGGKGPQGKHNVHWDQSWDNPFPIHRHPPGFRKGGFVGPRN